MLVGKQFRLERATLAVAVADGCRHAISIPVGSILKVVSGPNNGDGMVNVNWNGRIVEMFEIDVDVRGTEITDDGTSA
jgi:hypothetical protein